MNEITHTTKGNQLSTLTDRLSVAIELVKPASEDGIKAMVLRLHRAGLEWPTTIDVQKAADIYAFALKRCSLHALKLAVERIVQGEEKVDRYMPTPPALAAIVRRLSMPLHDDVARIRETLTSIEEGRQAQEANTPERQASIERVRALVAGVLDAAKEIREAERPPEMTEAEANYLFRNRVDEPDAPPFEKFSDEKWHQQQRELEDGNPE